MSNIESRLLHHMGQAVVGWGMIADGDRVLACLSGGKDSWALLWGLLQLQRRAPVNFTVQALKVDYPHTPEQNAAVADGCRALGVPFQLVNTRIGEIIAERGNPGGSHCAFCARLRRGHIYTRAAELGSTRVALGHHREDLNETLLLNLFHHGRLRPMPPRYRPRGRGFDVIRPLALTPEADIIALVEHLGLPLVPANCPLADNTRRAASKDLLARLTDTFPDIAGNLLAAQREAGLLEPRED